MHETRTDSSNAITRTLPKAGLSTSGGSLRTLPVRLRGGVEIGSRGDYDIRTASEGREDGPTEAKCKGVVSIMTVIWQMSACEHGIEGQRLECLLLIEERLTVDADCCDICGHRLYHHYGSAGDLRCDMCGVNCGKKTKAEEQQEVCHHPERLPNGECEVCEDNDVQDFWLHRNGTGIYIQ